MRRKAQHSGIKILSAKLNKMLETPSFFGLRALEDKRMQRYFTLYNIIIDACARAQILGHFLASKSHSGLNHA